MSKKREPGFWRGFAWGAIGLPMIAGAVGLVATTVVAIAAAIASPKNQINGE